MPTYRLSLSYRLCRTGGAHDDVWASYVETGGAIHAAVRRDADLLRDDARSLFYIALTDSQAGQPSNLGFDAR